MNKKRIITIALALFVAVAIGYLAYTEIKGGHKTKTIEQTKIEAAGRVQKVANATHDRVVMVYYFHTNFRCYSCKTIEQHTRGAINEYFAKELQNGKLLFTAVNVEEPQHKHFVEEYKLHTKSVVLVEKVKGKQVRWQTLEKTWNYVRDKDRFFDYIKQEVHNYLEGTNG